jgi:hypothetical protein
MKGVHNVIQDGFICIENDTIAQLGTWTGALSAPFDSAPLIAIGGSYLGAHRSLGRTRPSGDKKNCRGMPQHMRHDAAYQSGSFSRTVQSYADRLRLKLRAMTIDKERCT